METFIVTGGAGFIGSHVVDLLVEHGHRVHVIDDLSTGKRANLNPAANLHKIDIRSSKLPALFRRLKPAVVIHLAAQISVRRSSEDPAADADINIIGGLNVLKATHAANARHFVFASSGAAYGSAKTLPTPEDAPLAPSSPYGIAKAAFERYLLADHELSGMSDSILRFANVYGPRQNSKGEAGVVAIFLKYLCDGVSPTINGNGGQSRDFVYVGDIARMVVLAAERRLHGIFNVSTGVETSINDIFRILRQISGSEVEAKHAAAKPNEDRRSVLDPRRAAKVGWRPQVSIEEGLSLAYASVAKTRSPRPSAEHTRRPAFMR
ncbi:MAG: NAD-dependent epimerase/dehydratase family protein [Patescibacteria group bacterium]